MRLIPCECKHSNVTHFHAPRGGRVVDHSSGQSHAALPFRPGKTKRDRRRKVK